MTHLRSLIRRLKTLLARHLLLSGLGLLVMIALIMTSISMTLYVLSGASGLDLSRPGFSTTRTTLSSGTDDTTFDSAGALDQSDVDQFKTMYQKQRKKLREIGSFNDSTLSDESLGLNVPPETPDTVEQ